MPAFSPSFPDLRAQYEAQVDFLNQVSCHALDTLKQLSDLNMHMTRRIVDDALRIGHALAACNDPVQMGSVALREIPPAAEDWRSWQSSLMNVLTAGGATLARDANDGGWQAARNAASAGAAHTPA
ncbi:hypothetical protein ACFPOU_08625 [Massilia jejuensis]|uniref:Phasin protein n=1 Tax=Massilia jejuensis TaxID=648894 RepID=A0ABW0PEX6_9BURK